MKENKKNAKQKVLISGANYILAQTLSAELNEFVTRVCIADKSELQQAAAEFCPDITLVCLQKDTNEQLQAYVSLREVNATYNKPILALGKADEQENLAVMLQQKMIYGVNESFTIPYITDRIRDVIFNCDPSDIDVFKARELAVEFTDTDTGRLMQRTPHILIIDDELKALRMLKNQLLAKYRISAVSNADKGAALLQRDDSVDCVLIDYDLNGTLAPAIVKSIKARYRLPVLVLVKISDPMNIEERFEIQPDDFYLKPVQIKENTILDNPGVLDEKIISLLKKGRWKLSAKIPD